MEGSKPNTMTGQNVYEYVFTLEEQVRNLQNQQKFANSRIIQQDIALKRTNKELENYRQPPLVVGTILELIDSRAIVRNSNGMEFLVKVPEDKLNDLEVGKRIAMTQRNLTVEEVLPDIKDPRARAMEIIEKPTVGFKDIGGLKDEIRELEETVVLPLTMPKIFENLGIDSPKGILLYGAPGTGKTMLAKAVANQTNATFIGISGSELVKKYIGEGARLVRDIFKIAKDKGSAIIFIDEIDAIAAQRMDVTTGGDREVQRTLMQLLSEMDGFKESANVKIIGATNRIDILDPAILRAGRFDRIIEVPLPPENARKQILKLHSNKMKLSNDVKVNQLAKLTDGANGAELKTICTEAGIFALREKASSIGMKHFNEAVTKVMGEEEEDDHKPHKMFA